MSMKTMIAVALGAALIAGPALAQATPPASPSPASPPASTTDSQTAPAASRDGARPGRGAYIKMEAPGGAEITVRCADGESTKACADTVLQLVERTRSMSGERRRDWDRDGRSESRSDEYRPYRGGERNRDY
jgi:hypothetical protein